MAALECTSAIANPPLRGDRFNHSKKRGRTIVKAIAAKEGLPMAA